MSLNNEILGVDVNRQWEQFNGDLVLIDGVDNVYQALYNRLTCRYGDMAYFYSNYGSKIYDWLCSPNYQRNLDLLAEEVAHRVVAEPRISNVKVQVDKINDYLVNIFIDCVIDETDTFETNFVLNSLSNQLYYSAGEKTRTFLSFDRWNCPFYNISRKEVRRGETLQLLCKVQDLLDEPIPIGRVDYYIGNKFIQSVDVERGYADYLYTIPTSTPKGVYPITAYFSGIGRWGSSHAVVDIEVVDKYTTKTSYMNNPLYGLAGEQICLPTTVKDINGGNVTGGTVTHYLNITEFNKLATTLTISDMYATYGDSSCVFQDATLIDGWGDPVECGLINFYINNGLNMLRATKTVIDNTYTSIHEPQRGFYYGNVIDETNQNVLYGDFSWYLRKYDGGLKTTTILPDTQTMYKSFMDCILANVTDEDHIPVREGEFDFYIRCLKACKPFDSKTVLDYAFALDENMDSFMSALVTDYDGYPVDAGNVDYSFLDEIMDVSNLGDETIAYDLTQLPLAFEPSRQLTSSSPYMRAMIVDNEGVVIDVGDLVTEETNNGVVSTYVSNDQVDMDDVDVEFRLRGENSGEEENR